jgi:UDPglucose 6-dehydrogenase
MTTANADPRNRSLDFETLLVVTTTHAKKLLADVYQPVSSNEILMLYTTKRNAQVIKYAANGFLASKILPSTCCCHR